MPTKQRPTDRLSQLEEAIGDAEASLRRLRLEMETERNRVTYVEPRANGSVIRFDLEHLNANGFAVGKVYQYAAVRASGRWFTTGSTCPPRGYSWEDLWHWIAHNKLVAYYSPLQPIPTEVPF